ncbi:helix-turn-helix domain-containing protein [Agrobacterium tumefaciens]|uniref:helix-turn-helix domain-containing protein n=1 Tax=Agrobacterium tumefaciens TaxID=358 RepID=UPI0021FD8B47|nr:helix-turn-helix domain-containing protein [Agrobacterium tumefaciens]
MFEQIGAVLVGAPAERERTPVRRQSRAAGKCEGVFWRRTDRQEVRRIVLAARRYELACRQPGSRNGPLGGVAIEVLELFANLVNFRTGRLDPSIDFLMLKLRRSRDAIVRALKALRSHGFLDWLRRYVPTGNEGRGPQVQQTSNAYRLSLPARARQFLGRFGIAPPPPDDHAQAEAERGAEMVAHRASLPMDELALFDVGDNPLGQALARLARSMKQRESAKQTESPSGFIKDRKE